MSSRVLLLVLLALPAVAATSATMQPRGRASSPTGLCSMGNSVLTREALARLSLIATDTAEYFQTLRVHAGMEPTTPRDLAIVTDTVICRRAVHALHAYYDTTGFAARARSVDSGLLVRAGVNRLILVVALFNPRSGSQWTVLDSSFNVVRNNM